MIRPDLRRILSGYVKIREWGDEVGGWTIRPVEVPGDVHEAGGVEA